MAALPQSVFTALEGNFRTFGEDGPLYEVLGHASRSSEGEDLIAIRVLDSGETLNYRLDRLLADPEAK